MGKTKTIISRFIEKTFLRLRPRPSNPLFEFSWTNFGEKIKKKIFHKFFSKKFFLFSHQKRKKNKIKREAFFSTFMKIQFGFFHKFFRFYSNNIDIDSSQFIIKFFSFQKEKNSFFSKYHQQKSLLYSIHFYHPVIQKRKQTNRRSIILFILPFLKKSFLYKELPSQNPNLRIFLFFLFLKHFSSS